jgi:KipI family sensor histidine kinase inhibitor
LGRFTVPLAASLYSPIMAVRIVPASDRSLLVSFGEEISPETRQQVVALTQALSNDPIDGVLNLHPAYSSVLVVFDPLRTEHATVANAILARPLSLIESPARVVEIPVCYGGEFGPDLDDVASRHGLTPPQVIDLHSSVEYTVSFLGFVPGFAYLTGLPPELATPRLDAPRRSVPRGSVGIAGAQTGIYPFSTPGGWRLIGRTPVTMFDSRRNPMSLLEIGDRVRFTPIPPERM